MFHTQFQEWEGTQGMKHVQFVSKKHLPQNCFNDLCGLLGLYLCQKWMNVFHTWHTYRQDVWVSTCKIREHYDHWLWRNMQRNPNVANIETVLWRTVYMLSTTSTGHCTGFLTDPTKNQNSVKLTHDYVCKNNPK